MPMRVLIVEDTPDVGEAIVASLSRAGYAVDWQMTGEGARDALNVQSYDLIILDVMLPDIDGFTLLAEIRARKIDTAVLVLTARSQVDDRVGALDLGADDYLVKPFDFRELEARARALARRRHGATVSRLEVGDVVLDQAARLVTVAGQRVDLTRREVALLEVLMARPQRVFSKPELLNQLFGFGEEANENAIELYVARLRRKLGQAGMEIKTVRGVGYQAGPVDEKR
jgi:two-component system response regulator TctD